MCTDMLTYYLPFILVHKDTCMYMERHGTFDLRQFTYVHRVVLNIIISQRFNENLHSDGQIQ
jgi:hypothetical protein